MAGRPLLLMPVAVHGRRFSIGGGFVRSSKRFRDLARHLRMEQAGLPVAAKLAALHTGSESGEGIKIEGRDMLLIREDDDVLAVIRE